LVVLPGITPHFRKASSTQEAEIRKIMVQSQLGQIVCKTLSWKKKKEERKKEGKREKQVLNYGFLT
jgi:ribonucleotide reductase alpha subunit